jgi:putative transposase
MPEIIKTIKCKLSPTPSDKEALYETVFVFGDACNFISGIALEHRCWNKVALHHLCYYKVRELFQLPAQLACTARDKVAEAYKSSKNKKLRKFGFYTSVRLDMRTFAITKNGEASISTLKGRLHVPMILGKWQAQILSTWEKNNAAELCYDKNTDTFYVHIIVKKDVPIVEPTGRFVGVDIGMVNLATSSLGHKFSGKYAQHVRRHHRDLRASLASKGTHGAHRCMKRLQGRESRQMAAINHLISRRIVDDLLPGDVLALEDLKYIRDRAKQQKKQRADFHSWAFGQLQTFLTYKAKEKGCYTIFVDPKYTSQECSICGTKGKRDKHKFFCASCGHSAHADINACFNILRRAQLAPPDGLLSISPKDAPLAAAPSRLL